MSEHLNHLARRTPFSGTPAGTASVGASDLFPTDGSALKHQGRDAFSLRSATPTSTFASKHCGSHHISKPRQTNVDARFRIQSARLCEAAYRTGTKLYVGHNLRHAPVMRLMKQIIDEGRIGEVKAIWHLR